MWNKLKDKFIQTKNWILDKWHKLKEWFLKYWKKITSIAIIGTAIAAGGLIEQNLNRNEISIEKINEKYNSAQQIKEKYTLDRAVLIRDIIKNSELDRYKGEPKDRIKITIGDNSKEEFVPKIKLERWDEVNFSITPKDLDKVDTKDKTLSFDGDKINFTTPKMNFSMYDVPVTANDEGSYKFIWYLNEPPATNKVEFDIETSGLDFFYQPALNAENTDPNLTCTETQCKDADGNVVAERPQNVVGSYVAYHSGNPINYNGGKEYKTGQAFFIYRPHIIDAEGKETWGILHIENGIYQVEIPQDFLDTCRYPIKSNDTFGYTTAGGSFTFTAANRAFISKGSPTSSGTVSKISIYAARNTADTNFKGVIWLVSDKTIITNGVAGTVTITGAASWLDVNYGTNPDVVSGTNYYVGGVSDVSGGYLLYNTGVSGDGGISESNSYATPISLGTIGVNDRRHSIYATYTASGGGAAAEPEFYYQIIE